MSDIARTEDAVPDSSSPPLVDRLSLLPNELLDSIFESAYSDESPEVPLSKHLYPFFEEHFYRRVHLSSPCQVDLFLETITAHPDRGKLVKLLEFDRKKPEVIDSIEILESLFPLLTNLHHLEIKAEWMESGTRSKSLFESLSKVEAVSIEPRFVGCNRSTILDSLAFLTALPSLSSLTVLDWPIGTSAYYEEEEETFTLPHVRYLSIEGPGADEGTIDAVLELCPAILSIELSTTYDGQFISYAPALEVLPATLQSLRLGSEYASISPRDDLLPRFTGLESLNLDKECYSKEIHITLARLPLLVSIRLGHGTISPSGFLNLVSGPTRLIKLERITLDFKIGSRGRRVSCETRSTFQEEDEMYDWNLSEDIEDGEDEQDEFVVNLVQLVSVAESNEVEVRGTVHEALALVKDYWIEASNRAILLLQSRSEEQELIQEDFDRLRDIRQSATTNRVSLPQLDIDSLNRTQLKLVKIDLPERNWYMYSLENGGGALEDENVSEERV